MRVAVCTPTLRRPEGLGRLLEGLGALDVADPAGLDVQVVVVDNDGEGSARDVVRRAATRLPFPVRYVVEPNQGLSFARNRAVAEAIEAGAEFVAFIDDDEVPEPGWLRELVAVQRATGADAVIGPVLPRLPDDAPGWVVKGGFFDPLRFPTGHRLPWGVTNNALIAVALLARLEGPFSARFNRLGGEDTHFFMRARLTVGTRVVFADGARVVEHVPSSRTNARWILSRQYRRGNTLSLCLVELAPSPLRYAKRVAAAVVAALHGVALMALTVRSGRVAVVRGLQRIAFGAGLLAGLVGVRFEEYRTIHGT